MAIGVLLRLAGLMNLKMFLCNPINIQRRELYSGDFVGMFLTLVYFGHLLIFFKLSVMIDTTELKTLIPK